MLLSRGDLYFSDEETSTDPTTHRTLVACAHSPDVCLVPASARQRPPYRSMSLVAGHVRVCVRSRLQKARDRINRIAGLLQVRDQSGVRLPVTCGSPLRGLRTAISQAVPCPPGLSIHTPTAAGSRTGLPNFTS
ncbi:Uncharacterised protein [Mycobacteroides abscessus subsp. massiliense]|nr:Uncharacterised protein [Mycobacteroides abscessus]SKM83181.1 Uncharacterised protein [Mycobacteroides abscessus subsp. massiliense]SKU73576.1 Uncharacterised protein [Mycobacteroides abscessus subsp. abscessus]